MGHTLVAGFSDHSRAELRRLLEKAGLEDAVRIPYRHDCDRRAANHTMKHHITLVHWSRTEDDVYLKRLENYVFPGPCTVRVLEPEICRAESDSLMLYLNVDPTKEFRDLTDSVSFALGTHTTHFLHVTLAISKDHEKIREGLRKIRSRCEFPMTLKVSQLDLYHIWNPVELVRSFR